MERVIEGAWGGLKRIDTEMEGMKDIKEMLRMVLEQQKELTKQEKLIVKVEGMEAIQNAQVGFTALLVASVKSASCPFCKFANMAFVSN